MVGTTSGIIATNNGADVNLRLLQGKTVDFQVVWGGEDNPIDVSGGTTRLTAKTADGTVIVDFTGANTSVGGVDGLLTFTMSAAQTSALSILSGTYETIFTDSGGDVDRVESGNFVVEEAVAI